MADVDVLLIHPPYHRRHGSGVIPPIGLAYIAAVLRLAGYSCRILDGALIAERLSEHNLNRYRSWLASELQQTRPGIFVGIGPCTTPALRSILATSEVLREVCPEVPSVYGGPLPSLASQAPLFFQRLDATAVVRGDGERAIINIADTLTGRYTSEDTSGVVWSLDLIPEPDVLTTLDTVPYPARDLLPKSAYQPSLRRSVFEGPITAVYLTRGCPYRCNFCLSPLIRHGKYVRRSMRNLTAELTECVQRFNTRNFIFYDDCLFIRSPRLNQEVANFAQALLELGGAIRWQMDLRCDAVAELDPSSFRVLWEAGCRQINMGIEKSTDAQLAYLEKSLTTRQIIRACESAKIYAPDIRLTGTFILGGELETENSALETIEFACNLPLDFAHFYPLEVYPETPLYRRMFPNDGSTDWVEKVLSSRDPWGEILFETEQLKRARLLALVGEGYRQFYERESWLKRFSSTCQTREELVEALSTIELWKTDRFNLA